MNRIFIGKFGIVLWISCILLPSVLGQSNKPNQPSKDTNKLTDADGFRLPEEALARIGSLRLLHGPYLNSPPVYTPNGKRLLTFGDPPGMCVWDAQTGVLLQTIASKVANNYEPIVQFEADGKHLRMIEAFLVGPAKMEWIDLDTGKILASKSFPQIRSDTVRSLRLWKEEVFAYTKTGTIRIWNIRTGKETKSIPLVQGEIRQLEILEDGKTFAIRHPGFDGIELFDRATGKSIRRMPTDKPVVSFLVAPDGSKCVADFDDRTSTILVWNLHNGKKILEIDIQKFTKDKLLSDAISHDGKWLACSDWPNQRILIFDLTTGQVVQTCVDRSQPRNSRPYPSTFSPDDQRLSSASRSGEIRQWDTSTGKLRKESNLIGRCWVSRFLDEDHVLTYSTTNHWTIQNWKTQRTVHAYPSTGELARDSCRLSPDGKIWAVPYSLNAKTQTTKDTQIVLIDAQTNQVLHQLDGHGATNHFFDFTQDNKRLATSGYDHQIQIRDRATGKTLQWLKDTLLTRNIELVRFSPQEQFLATSKSTKDRGRDPEIRIWNLQTEQLQSKFGLSEGATFDLAFTPNGQSIILVGGTQHKKNEYGEIAQYDILTGKMTHLYAQTEYTVSQIAMVPNGKMFATGSYETPGTVRLWETASGKQRHIFRGHSSHTGSRGLAVSPGGRYLASFDDTSLTFIWDVYGTESTNMKRFTQEEIQECWKQLSSEDATIAFQAIRKLIVQDKATLDLLLQHLQPVSTVENKILTPLLKDLGSDRFVVREKAQKALEQLGDRIHHQLKQALEQSTSEEFRSRVQDVLNRPIERSADWIRTNRMLEILEQIRSPEADEHIVQLTTGVAGSWITQEAKAIQKRREEKRGNRNFLIPRSDR